MATTRADLPPLSRDRDRALKREARAEGWTTLRGRGGRRNQLDKAISIGRWEQKSREATEGRFRAVDEWLTHVKEAAGGWPSDREQFLGYHLSDLRRLDTSDKERARLLEVMASALKTAEDAADRHPSEPLAYRHHVPVLASALGRLCGVAPATVLKWRNGGRNKVSRGIRIDLSQLGWDDSGTTEVTESGSLK